MGSHSVTSCSSCGQEQHSAKEKRAVSLPKSIGYAHHHWVSSMIVRIGRATENAIQMLTR